MPKRISPELKARAIRMVAEHRQAARAGPGDGPPLGGPGRDRLRWPDRDEPRPSTPRSSGSRRRTDGCGRMWRSSRRRLLSSRENSTPAAADHGVHRRDESPGPRGRVDLQSAHRARLPGCRADLPFLAERSSRIAARTVSDAVVVDALLATRNTPEALYGRRKMTHLLRRRGLNVAFCTVDRLMRDLAMSGVRRGQAAADHDPDQGRAPRRGPAGPQLHRCRTQPGMGRRLHLRAHLGRVRLCRLHRRRLRPRGSWPGTPRPTSAPAWSSRRCGWRYGTKRSEVLVLCLCWCLPTEGLAGSGVEGVRDGLDFPGGSSREVRFALPASHLQGVHHQLGADVVGDRPAHDPAGEPVDDRAAVHPAVGGAVLGDVGEPHGVRCLWDEPALHQVDVRGLRRRPAATLAPMTHPGQAADPHQPGHPLASHPDPEPRAQLGVHPRRPVGATGLVVHPGRSSRSVGRRLSRGPRAAESATRSNPIEKP